MKHLIAPLFALSLAAPVAAWAEDAKPEPTTYSKNEVLQEIESFFGEGAEGLADVVEKAFDDHGEPNAYIAGEEVAAAIGFGVRYGKGKLKTRAGYSRTLYWQGPSLGFDVGANASKVFVLIYKMPAVAELFQRHPGVEGSLYFVGGVGINYLQTGDMVIAPIRFGAGWRQGISAGYMDFTREKSLNPF